jgi:lantibiotic biosynthesis protein
MTTVEAAELLAAATRIGSRLCRDAIFAGDRCNWIGAGLEHVEGAWTPVHRALGGDLYDGTAGIALFLAHLAAYTDEPAHRKTARAAATHARLSAQKAEVQSRLGLYSGTIGIACALCEIDSVLPGEGWRDRAFAILRELPPEPEPPAGLDVVSGCAGAILGLLAFQRRCLDESFLERATRLGDALIARARRRNGAWSWAGEMPAADDLAGFSHGAAGIALALLELWAATNEQRFRNAAEAGFAYERLLFDAEHQNWPDLRVFDQLARESQRMPAFSLAWCHGAPGIGFTRLRAFVLTGDERYRAEAEIAIATTTRDLRAVPSFSLCHGIFGNAELLIAAHEILGDTKSWELACTTALWGAEQYPTGEYWPCGVLNAGETPGLMLGLAGIGHHFLRLLDPKVNRSVLLIV